MKRSEAVSAMVEHINENVSYYYKNGVTFNDYDAESLLSVLENLGMLPPWSDAMKVCDCSMLSSCVGCAPNIFMPKWENEQ